MPHLHLYLASKWNKLISWNSQTSLFPLSLLSARVDRPGADLALFLQVGSCNGFEAIRTVYMPLTSIHMNLFLRLVLLISPSDSGRRPRVAHIAHRASHCLDSAE